MKVLQIDLFRYSRRTTLYAGLLYFVKHPGFRFVCLKRSCEKFPWFHPLGFFARMWYKRMQVKFGYQIPHTCKIGGGFFIGHYGNIVINQGVVIGRNCNVAQGVTIGQSNRGPRMGTPTLGERVWVGSNAVLVGKITVGNDVLIAPLSYVTEDIPDQAVVSGNPARIINSNGSRAYVNNTLDC